MNYRYFFAATYDVQSVTATKGGNEIKIRVQFINNSRAMGCFIVLQSNDNSGDEFKVLFRKGLQVTVTDIIKVRSSKTYAVYAYDLEKNGHINKMPAYLLADDRINIKKKGGLHNEMGKINLNI